MLEILPHVIILQCCDVCWKCVHVGVWHNNNAICACVYASKSKVNFNYQVKVGNSNEDCVG